MSAAPQFPPGYRYPEEPPSPPRRRAFWKRVLLWTGGILLAVILLVVIGVVVLLHSRAAHDYILRVAQQKATANLGSNVAVGNYGLHFSGISPVVDLYDVRIAGAAPYTEPPLLTVDRVHVAVQVVSLLSRKWYLRDVRVVHPVVRVMVDAHGTDNLPQTKSENQSSNQTSVFDLGVRHAVLDGGEVFYNNRKSALNADLHELNFQAAFATATRSYSGTLSYRDGHLQMESFNPVPHDLDAQFTATPDKFTLQRAVLRSGASEFVLNATLDDYAHPRLRAEYDARLDSGEFRRILKNPTLPAGVIRARGTLNYTAKPDVPLLQGVVLNGDLSSAVLRLTTPSFRGDIRDLAARYTVEHGNADVRDLRARLLGGELTGTMTMRDITGASRSHLTAALRGVSLAELRAMMNSPALRQVALSGAVDATADATWGRTTDDMIAIADATLNARVAPASAAAKAVPLDGVVHARYAAARKQITLTNSYLRLPQTSLTLNGTVSDRSALAVRLQANDLRELETIADTFRGPGSAPFGLAGQASFVGNVRGSTAAPQIAGQLTATNLRVKGTAWRRLRTNINASPSAASLQDGELDGDPRGRVTFNLSAGLRRWSFTETSPFQVALRAVQLNLAELAKAAGTQMPVAAGLLSADIAGHGTELNPIGQGRISLTNAQVKGERIQALNVNFKGTGDTVRANLGLRMPAGAADAVLTYLPKQRGYELQLQAPNFQLGQLQAAKSMGLNGALKLTASGRGTLDDPELTAVAEIPQLSVRDQTISGLKLQAAVAHHVANLALDSHVVNTEVRGRGTVNLTGGYETNATLDTQAIPLAPLVALYAPSQAGSLTGQTELHATVRGPLKNKALLEAHVVVPTLQVNYKNAIQIGAPQPIRADYAHGVLQVQRASLRGTGTDLQFEGTLPMTSNAPASMLLVGAVDLRLVQLFNPDVSSSGQLRFDINSYGQRANQDVQGQVQIVNATLASGDIPLGLQNGNGVLTLTRDRLNITRFEGLVGGGKVTASGGVVYRPAMNFDLALAGDGVRLLYNGVRTTLGTDLALTGTTDQALLRGQVRIENLQFTPDFDLMTFMGSLGGGNAMPPPTGGFTQALQMNVGVASTSNINLVSRTMSLQGAANLRVTGTAAQPVILGRVNINGGDMVFMGNRYVLQQGTLDFVNPAQTMPVVNASVNTTIQQYNIQMHFWGPADHLHTNYSSDPALPPADVINLVAFGKTNEYSAANPSPPGNLGAQSLVANQVSSQVTSRVEKLAGISQLSVDPLMGCDQQSRGACLTIQQRVTSKVFVTFGTDVTSTQRATIKLEYQKSPRLSFSGTRDQNGGFGFDTRIHKNW